MSIVNERECVAAGKDPRTVERLTKRFSKLGVEAKKLGITVFGGSGSGSLRARNDGENGCDRPLILAHLDGVFDGGDGGTDCDSEGLLRGE